MIKTFVACTAEVDDAQVAIEEVTSQLLPDVNLLSNSIGIISCHQEFVESGVFKAVCDHLPFEVVGVVSSQMSNGALADSLLMTIMLITSDDVEFITSLTPSILNDTDKNIAETYKKAVACKTERPSLAFVFAPFLMQNSGDSYVNVLNEASNGVPLFGALATDDTENFSSCYTLFDGEFYQDKMAIVLVYGNISPKFYIANVSTEKILKKSAVVTKSEGHIIMEVNGHSVDDFFQDLGLTKASETTYGMASIPFMIDYNDSTPKVSKMFITLTPERYALLAGAVPEGCTLCIAPNDRGDILRTTGKVLDEILEDIDNASGMIIFSCIGRNMSLGTGQYDEMELANERVGGAAPFMMLSAGGEICPTHVSDEKVVNRFHNATFVAILF